MLQQLKHYIEGCCGKRETKSAKKQPLRTPKENRQEQLNSAFNVVSSVSKPLVTGRYYVDIPLHVPNEEPCNSLNGYPLDFPIDEI